jgi:hypothetical protein
VWKTVSLGESAECRRTKLSPRPWGSEKRAGDYLQRKGMGGEAYSKTVLDKVT